MHLPSFAAVVLAVLAGSASAGFVNTNVKRRVDLKTAVVRMRSEFSITGDSDASSSKYDVYFSAAEAEHLAFIEAKDGDGNTLSVEPTGERDGFSVYRVQLSKGVRESDKAVVKVTTHHTHSLTPFPAEITQLEGQLVVFKGSAYIPSPYTSTKQLTTVKLPSRPRVESHTQVKPTSLEGESLKYGPYKNVAPASSAPVEVHYQNNAPFMTVTNLDKEIEVSHWGNVAVEEQYDLLHTGAKLKGGFARVDYQSSLAVSASYRSLKATLPSGASDIYYRDIIGNISTSHVRESEKGMDMEIETRFPMFGGWKTQWYQGYNLPSESVLTHDGDTYTLSIDFASPYEGIVTDNLFLKIILPEGASVESATLPVTATRHPDAQRFTYLDAVQGRTVLSFSTTNLVARSNGKLTLVYSMAPMSMLREPVLLVSAFFALFLSYSILSRIDLSISKSHSD